MVPWDRFDEAVEWYRDTMGWRLNGTATGPVGRKAFFKLPGMGQANLKSFESGMDHFTMEDYAEGHCRFCFRTANLEQTLLYFTQQGVEISEPVNMPDGTWAADIQAFGGSRLTLCEDRKLEGKYPDSRIIQYAAKPLWLGVRNLEAATVWYERVLGFAQSDHNFKDRGFVLMRDVKDEWDFAWLEQIPSTSKFVKANPGARLYFQIEERADFEQTHSWLKEQALEVSEIVGERWQGFHFYDPDGNRLNVWNYY